MTLRKAQLSEILIVKHNSGSFGKMNSIFNCKLFIPILITLLLYGCTDADEVRPIAQRFFSKLISNRYNDATKMIETNSTLYRNRNEVFKNLKFNKSLGKLNSTGGGIMASSSETLTTFSYTRISFSVKLNYDSSSVMARVTVIDRGNGFKINKIEL